MAERNARTITTLNENDVLLGRGRGPSQYVGNQKFLSLVKTKKQEYNCKHVPNKTKAAIANEIYCKITEDRGGRFLSLVNENGQRTRNLVEEGVWVVVHKDHAIEKVKQALRQRREKDEGSRGPSQRSKRRNDESLSLQGEASMHPQEPYNALSVPQDNTMLPRSLLDVAGSSDLDLLRIQHQIYLLNSQQHPSFISQQSLLQNSLNGPFSQAPLGMAVTLGVRNAAAQTNMPSQAPICNQHIQSLLRSFLSKNEGVAALRSQLLERSNEDTSVARIVGNEQGRRRSDASDVQSEDLKLPPRADASQANSRTIDEAELEALTGLTALKIAALPKFTPEQEESERAAMTDEERAAALSDIFGKYNAVSSPMNKRTKRDLDPASIEFLTKQMRMELETIPLEQKEALVEAQAKCFSREYEFSDERLLQFLRCAGMDARLGAQRLVMYWQARKDIFGSEKFLQRMTLSEALQDDLEAIEEGVLSCLPFRDESGRQMVFLEPHRRTRGRYSSESMLRAFWYVAEVLSQGNKDVNSGFIFVVWDKEVTLFDYDPAYDRMMYFEMSCWPIQCIGAHQCCPTGILMKVLRPVLIAMSDARLRARTRWHCVPESEIFNVLAEFGIYRYMLPTRMGGNVPLNQSAWMENRRAIEMQEIS